MENNEIAKKLLNNEIDPQLLWIYDITNGYIDSQDYKKITALNNEASVRGYDIRIIKKNTIITADFQLKRININLRDDNYITTITIG